MCRRILLWRLSISEPGCRKLVPRMTCTVVVSTVPSIHNTVPRTTCSYYGISVLQHYTWQSTTQYPVPHALCTTVCISVLQHYTVLLLLLLLGCHKHDNTCTCCTLFLTLRFSKLFVAIVAAVATILTFKREDSTAKTKTACEQS
jgi:hypothetical protein